ncbi:hypothetical protein [Pseudonocardia sp. T1-2H]|uniref:hypothetical protein n=1 Tax=Pseudonocardia sp. T1-2H TaxID=3128899 RepID=UPI0031014DB6
MPADEWASKHELAIEVGGAVELRERVPERVEAQRDQSVSLCQPDHALAIISV